MFFGEVMLVEGNTARKWEACFDDLVTETKYNEVKDTVDSHTRTIGEQGNSISQAIQTAQGLVTRVNNLKSGSRNYLLNSKLTTTDMTGISDTGSLDVPINISADCWKHDDVYKNQKIRLSLYYQSSVAYSTSRTFPVYFRKSPWYQIGTITYPANTVKLMKFEFTFGTMPTGFDATQIFIRFDRTLDRGRVHTIERAHLEVSDMFSDWSPAPEDGNQAIQAVSTQVNTLAGSWSVQNLNSSGDILSQANLSSTQFLLEAAKIRLKGKTLADEIQAIDGKFGTLFVADGTFAKLNATVIGSQAITADKLKVDQAFFDKLIANDAYLRQLFAKSVFTTQVQSVTLSASKISGGILTATNKAMEVNLNAGQIMYYTDQAALKRVLNGYPTQFVKFATGTVTGKGNAGVTVIGSNRWNSESSNDGGFVGIRAWNGANIDSLDLVGDDIRLASSAFDNPDGWDVRTLDSGLRIAPHNRAAERNSRIEVGDVWIMKGDGTYSSLRDILNSFNGNFSKGPNADSYTYYPKGF
ncbi:prophage LambdaSa2%2C PblB [Streptococcus suis]|nr:prophage LambdaSa2%2C PblB [Streptococcus suis]